MNTIDLCALEGPQRHVFTGARELHNTGIVSGAGASMVTDSLGYDGHQIMLPGDIAGDMRFLEKMEFVSYYKPTDCITYKSRNLKIKKKGQKVTIEGSPATFLNGDNSESLDWKDIRRALEAESDELGVNCFRGILWMNEFAATVRVNKFPISYFQFLHLSRRGREEMPHGHYLQKKNRTCVLHAYEKGEYMLRLEARRRQIAKLLGRPYPIYAEDLCDERVFNLFALDWQIQIANALALCVVIPQIPEHLTKKSLALLESQLCRRNPETRHELTRIVEDSYRGKMIDPNLRAPLLRELHSPCSPDENVQVAELRSKIGMLLDARGINRLNEFRESKPILDSSKQ